MRMRF